MQKLAAVEEARAVMREGMEWSVWKWLTEKKRVRGIADAATAAFDKADEEVKATWSDSLKKAYREVELEAQLEENPKMRKQYEKARDEAKGIDEKIKETARRIYEADAEAYNARMDAEETFDVAERHLSAAGARDGARKALECYDLREKAIRKSEAARKQFATAS